jgi:isopentenyl diphosphate isomerase/L-lactate dehydrogenase-like FMN-dependent dehydrogenase
MSPTTGVHGGAGEPPQREDQHDGGRDAFINLTELEALASRVMTQQSLDYYRGFAGDGVTARENVASWSRLRLLPRILRDVSRCSTATAALGGGGRAPLLSAPIIVAPMAMHGLADPVHAERATVRAAAQQGVGMAVSTMANVRLEELAALEGARDGSSNDKSSNNTNTTRPPLLLFQLYVLRDRDLVASMVRRAETSGYDALVVTVDAPRLGRREADERNRFALPEGLELGNLRELAEKKGGKEAGEAVLRAAVPDGGAAADPAAAGSGGANAADQQQQQQHHQSGLFALFASEVDDSLDWSFLAWLKSVTSLPIWVKGLLHPADAVLAAKHGASAVVVSNHGGRQLDTSPTSADALPAVAAALAGTDCLIIADGGVRRGTDVVKALALGAHAVMVGRPVLYALAVGGEQGVARALALLKQETELALALCGWSSCEQARREGAQVLLRGVRGEVPLEMARVDDGGGSAL